MISQESVVEVQPEFDEAPSNWLETFDQYNNVQDQYSVSLPDGGIAHVVIEPQVKQVLNEIKKCQTDVFLVSVHKHFTQSICSTR